MLIIAEPAQPCYTQPSNSINVKGMFNDFKAFVMRGNVLDLAVGVIIGGAFGKIVTSLVNDVLMPFISVIAGGIDFSAQKVKIGGSASEPVYLAWGTFVQSLIDFLIIAGAIFLFVRFINRLHKAKPAPSSPPAPLTKDQELLIEIRDALKK